MSTAATAAPARSSSPLGRSVEPAALQPLAPAAVDVLGHAPSALWCADRPKAGPLLACRACRRQTVALQLAGPRNEWSLSVAAVQRLLRHRYNALQCACCACVGHARQAKGICNKMNGRPVQGARPKVTSRGYRYRGLLVYTKCQKTASRHKYAGFGTAGDECIGRGQVALKWRVYHLLAHSLATVGDHAGSWWGAGKPHLKRLLTGCCPRVMRHLAAPPWHIQVVADAQLGLGWRLHARRPQDVRLLLDRHPAAGRGWRNSG